MTSGQKSGIICVCKVNLARVKALTKELGGGLVQTSSPFLVIAVRIWVQPEKLKVLRTSIPGLSQQKLADLAGIKFRQYIGLWENGHHVPTAENMQKLAIGFAKALAELKQRDDLNVSGGEDDRRI